MERKFLEGIKIGEETLSKEIIDSIMAEHGKAFKEKDEKIQNLTTEKDGLSSQLQELNVQVKKFSELDTNELQNTIKTLNEKYENDTKALSSKLSKQNYEFKIKEITNGIKFSSESAKKAFIQDLKEKDLKLEENKILGFDDFLNSYKETDPNAFQKEQEIENTAIYATGETDTNTKVAEEDAFINKIMGLK
jgi:hypothetical protein